MQSSESISRCLPTTPMSRNDDRVILGTRGRLRLTRYVSFYGAREAVQLVRHRSVSWRTTSTFLF